MIRKSATVLTLAVLIAAGLWASGQQAVKEEGTPSFEQRFGSLSWQQIVEESNRSISCPGVS